MCACTTCKTMLQWTHFDYNFPSSTEYPKILLENYEDRLHESKTYKLSIHTNCAHTPAIFHCTKAKQPITYIGVTNYCHGNYKLCTYTHP